MTEELGAVVADRTSFFAIVYRSTVPPGTVDGRMRPILERVSGRRADDDFGVGMVPEFLREGSSVDDFFAPPFTVAGVRDDRTLELVTRTFAPIEQPIHALSIEAAESLKYACNAYHAVKITFANEIGRLLSAVDVDAREVMRVFCEDHRLNISAAYLRPGFSFGGSCLPKDLRALMHIARIADVDVPMLSGVMRSNDSHLQLATRTDSRQRRAHRRVARTELQAADRRPSREPLRRARGIPRRGKGSRSGSSTRSSSPRGCSGRTASTSRSTYRISSECCARLRRMRSATPGSRSSRPRTAMSSVPCSRRRPRLVLDLHGSVSSELEALPGYSGIAW